MEIPENMVCLFSSRITKRDDSYVIDVPEQEISQGDVTPGGMYRIACINWENKEPEIDASSTQQDEGDDEEEAPPVQPGDHRDVEIVDLGKKGDGIATVERGYILVVPEATIGDHVTVEVTNTLPNVGFAEVVTRKEDGVHRSESD